MNLIFGTTSRTIKVTPELPIIIDFNNEPLGSTSGEYWTSELPVVNSQHSSTHTQCISQTFTTNGDFTFNFETVECEFTGGDYEEFEIIVHGTSYSALGLGELYFPFTFYYKINGGDDIYAEQIVEPKFLVSGDDAIDTFKYIIDLNDDSITTQIFIKMNGLKFTAEYTDLVDAYFEIYKIEIRKV